MTRLLTPLLLLAALVRAADEATVSCVTHCHGQESKAFASSAHASALACVTCHGGDPAAQRDKEKSHDVSRGFRGKIARDKIPELCSSCHSDAAKMNAYALPTDQMEHYKTSVHGTALFQKGDLNVAVCTDCHSSHEILHATDPRAPTARTNQPQTCGRCHSDAEKMKPYGLPSDIAAQFVKSVHGQALLAERVRGAPGCSDCHGAHGAVPPGTATIVQVCGHCHENTGEQYRKSPHNASGEMNCLACHKEKTEPQYRATGCATCHGAHDTPPPGNWMYDGDEVGHCGHCHRQADKSREVVEAIRTGRERLQDSMRGTMAQFRAANAQGLFIEDEEIFLQESQRALVSIRPLAHALDAAAIRSHLEDGIQRQDRTRETIAKKRNVLRDRRIILGGMSFLLLLLAVLLAVKLRDIRRLS